jgi:hypothetical protein
MMKTKTKTKHKEGLQAHLSRDVSDMPWGRPQICVAAVSQKLLPYNSIAFLKIKLKLYDIDIFIIFYKIS